MRDTREFPGPMPQGPPEPAPEAARAEGLRRLSRLTWRVTQLSAVTAVGIATLFARTAPAQSTANDGTTAPAVSSSPAAPASAPGKAHRKRARTAARPASPTARVTPQASSPTAASSRSATLAPPSSAPASAPPTSAAPTPKPTVSSASHGGG